MSALEREILEKFHQLHPAAKLRVQALIKQEVASEFKQTDGQIFGYAAWSGSIETFGERALTLYFLDTNAVSEVIASHPQVIRRAAEWLAASTVEGTA